jgi:hypothetical protein
VVFASVNRFNHETLELMASREEASAMNWKLSRFARVLLIEIANISFLAFAVALASI